MRALLEELGVEFDREVEAIISRAWDVHALRYGDHFEEEHVSRSTLLYATARVNPFVRRALELEGLRMEDWERAHGFPPSPRLSSRIDPITFPIRGVERAIRNYATRNPKRKLDAIAFAAEILADPGGNATRRLAEAGVNVEQAARRMATLADSGYWFRLNAVGEIRLGDLGLYAIEAATLLAGDRQLRMSGITASLAIVAILRAKSKDPGNAATALRTILERASGGVQTLEGAIANWLKWYGSTRGAAVDGTLLSMPLFRVLLRAREIAASTTGNPLIWGRHLVGAFIADMSAPIPSGATDFLAQLKIDQRSLASEFFNHLEDHAPRGGGDNLAKWREHLGLPRDPGTLPSYTADTIERDKALVDLLEIERDVDGFARLIASQTLKPPLSIGLFGNWGSGKSYFMRMLQQRIDHFATSGNTRNYHQRIVQIEFNAWHYVEANLWASLVENIFSNLKLSKDGPEDADKRRDYYLGQLDRKVARRADLEKRVAEKKQERDRLARELDTKKKTAETTAATLADLRARNAWDSVEITAGDRFYIESALANLGAPRPGSSMSELRQSLDELRTVHARSRLLTLWMFRQPAAIAVLLVLMLAAPVVAQWLAKLIGTYIDDVSKTFTQLATTIGAITAWVTTQLTRGKEALEELDAARNSIDEKVKKAEEEQRAAITAQETMLEKASEKLQQQESQLRKAETEVQRAQEALANLTPSRQLARFIDDRAATDDYRKLLGVLANVRRDFDQLTSLMKNFTARIQGTEYGIDRIVLYIDDLDRCDEARVVDVLQAVHLLLAFPLFVVVVGVDARWVSESLEKQHRALRRRRSRFSLAGAAGDSAGSVAGYRATAEDYLEKIFQVPFWVEPMSSEMTASFIRKLLVDDVRDEPVLAPAGAPAATTIVADSEGAPSYASTDPTRGTTTAQPAITEEEEEQLTSEQLRLHRKEEAYMTSLSALIGRSPRTVKRYINTYRLIRCARPPRKLRAFLDDSGVAEYQTILLLLAILVGAPTIAFEVLAAIEESKDQPLAQLAKTLRGHYEDPRRKKESAMVADALALFIKHSAATPYLRHLVKPSREVSRYSFRPRRAKTRLEDQAPARKQRAKKSAGTNAGASESPN